ncbi:MAG TPA: type II toxin-antitoxin system prevent-host-death family antitoxin [Terriglobia bacterium]|nr:type II toxin-antitoxin system prevent-host-death family antitoxin [Terriglobia bacterium]
MAATTNKTMPAAEFKAKCLKILDELDAGGIVITKRGRPVARVLPAVELDNRKLIGSMKGKIKVSGDILSTGLKWNAESRHSSRRGPARRKSK